MPKKCPKSVKKIDKMGAFYQKLKVLIQYDSFIHFKIKFNSKDYSITFFPQNSIQKLNLNLAVFNGNSIFSLIEIMVIYYGGSIIMVDT